MFIKINVSRAIESERLNQVKITTYTIKHYKQDTTTNMLWAAEETIGSKSKTPLLTLITKSNKANQNKRQEFTTQNTNYIKLKPRSENQNKRWTKIKIKKIKGQALHYASSFLQPCHPVIVKIVSRILIASINLELKWSPCNRQTLSLMDLLLAQKNWIS